MGGGDLNMKKSWHPIKIQNQERVWKAEQKDKLEKDRIAQLIREREEERQKEEIQTLAIKSGHVKAAHRLEWMYAGPGAGSQQNGEAFLLGKKLEKLPGHELEEEKKQALASAPGSLLASVGPSSMDLAAKIREDPMFLIKKRQKDQILEIRKNPVKMAELKKMLEKEKKKDKKAKKDKKKKKHKNKDGEQSGSDSEAEKPAAASNGPIGIGNVHPSRLAAVGAKARPPSPAGHGSRRSKSKSPVRQRAMNRSSSRDRGDRRGASRDSGRNNDGNRRDERERDSHRSVRRSRSPPARRDRDNDRRRSRSRSRSPRARRDRDNDRRRSRSRSRSPPAKRDRENDRRRSRTRSRSPLARRDRDNDRRRSRSRDRGHSRPNGQSRPGPRRGVNVTAGMDAEEKARRLAAMQANAKETELERDRRLEAARLRDEAEAERERKAAELARQRADDDEEMGEALFLKDVRKDAVAASASGTLEERINRNRGFIQRTNADLSKGLLAR